jgi:hypothetical protein
MSIWNRSLMSRVDSCRFVLLCRKRSSRAMPKVENGCNVSAFIHRINNSAGAWILPEKQMAKSLAFRDTWPVFGKSLKTVNCFSKLVEPRERHFLSIRFNELVDGLHVPQGAVGQANEA